MNKLFQKKFFSFCASLLLFFTAGVFPLSAQNSEIQFLQALSDALEKGDLEKAIKAFDSMPAELSEDSDMLILEASLLLSAGRTDDAEKIAVSLLEKSPNNVEILELNMMIEKDKGNTAKKKQLIQKILALNPYNPGANIELADEQALKRNYRNARDYYKKALRGDGENFDALFGYGKMCYYMENDDDSKNAFNKIISLDPQNPQANAYLAKFAAESGQYRKAIEHIGISIKENPENPDYYFDSGTYKRSIGDYSGAEKDWKTAVSLEPEYFLGYAYLAGLYDEQNKTDKALEYYKKVVEKNPEYYYAYESLGMFSWEKGDFADSQKYFESARKYAPDNISYGLMICACMMKQNKNQDVRNFTQQMMKKYPDRQSIEYKITRLFYDRVGDGDVALSIQKESNRTKKGRFLFYLALFYELTGKNSLAQKYYAEVCDMQSPMFFEYRMAQWKIGVR